MIIVMMMTIFTAQLIFFSKNPMKSAIALLVLSISMFYIMHQKMGMCWIPMILSLLFTGGILMTLMILSSIMPNESEGKNKFLYPMVMLMGMTMLFSKWEITEMFSDQQIKWMMQSKSSMAIMLTVMSIYFGYFISILSNSKAPMRSLT